jgi:hypothetical protein
VEAIAALAVAQRDFTNTARGKGLSTHRGRRQAPKPDGVPPADASSIVVAPNAKGKGKVTEQVAATGIGLAAASHIRAIVGIVHDQGEDMKAAFDDFCAAFADAITGPQAKLEAELEALAKVVSSYLSSFPWGVADFLGSWRAATSSASRCVPATTHARIGAWRIGACLFGENLRQAREVKVQ